MRVRPVILLVNVPVPVPLLVLLSAIVGFWTILQQTPLEVTVAPPSSVTLPPPEEEFMAMEDIEVDDTVGK